MFKPWIWSGYRPSASAEDRRELIMRDGTLAGANVYTLRNGHGQYMDARRKLAANLIEAAPELANALEALTDWGREYASPRDGNSPHQLLINAMAALAKARGE